MDKQTRRLWILGAVLGVFVLAGAGVYVQRQWEIVQHRKALLAATQGCRLRAFNGWQWSLLIRHWMGDQEFSYFLLNGTTDEEIATLVEAFPEAKVYHPPRRAPP